MVPITPFSTLAIYPLSALSPIAAKRWWITLNLGLLVATIMILAKATSMSWEEVSLIALLSWPLRANFLLGQYYVLLLFLLSLSFWLYIRKEAFLAGVGVGVAVALKIFPVLFLLYFLKRRDWRALSGGIFGTLAATGTAIYIFGLGLHKIYFTEILPRVLRGEGLDPYNLNSQSLSSLLHRLFIYEPQLNSHPAWNHPVLFAILHPLIQISLLSAVLMPIRSCTRGSKGIYLEWASVLGISLVLSTSSSTYLQTLLILSTVLLVTYLRECQSCELISLVLILFLLVGCNSRSHQVSGWLAFSDVPRLYALIALSTLSITLLLYASPFRYELYDRIWGIGLIFLAACTILSNVQKQRNAFNYSSTVVLPRDVFLARAPQAQGKSEIFIAMRGNGYRVSPEIARKPHHEGMDRFDDLSVAATSNSVWIEEAALSSTIVPAGTQLIPIRRAESPVISGDGRRLAFLREDHGRGSIWVRPVDGLASTEREITSSAQNTAEMSFMTNGELAFSSLRDGHYGLFAVAERGDVRPLRLEDSRYPSASPDGRWLAYSHLQAGSWNLWLKNLGDGSVRRLTDRSCNDIESAWTADSTTLIYASDCGRALWFTSIRRMSLRLADGEAHH